MQAIIIDADKRQLRAVEFDGDADFARLKAEAGIEWTTTVSCFGVNPKETLFVDDEGILKGWAFGFCVAGYSQPLHGSGIIVGTDIEGESVSTALRVEDLLDTIAFWRMDPDGEVVFLTARQASKLN